MRVLIHIEANLDRDLSAPALARAAGLSASRFHRVFVNTTQIRLPLMRLAP